MLYYKTYKNCLTFGLQNSNIILGYKSEVMKIESSKRIGRPTDNKKGQPIHIRLDDKSSEILEAYTKKFGVSRAEAVRRGIVKLESELG